MAKTAKELVMIARGLMGQDGKAFPSARDVIGACEGKGSALRAGHAVDTVLVERGITPHLRDQLPDEFKAEIASVLVPTMVPSFDAVRGFPKEALDLVQRALIHASVLVERDQAALVRRWHTAQGEWEATTGRLAVHGRELREELDEARRAAREQEAVHAAALSVLREDVGVLRKEIEFLGAMRDAEMVRIAQAETELAASREAFQREVDRCRAAEMRVAALEAGIAAHAERNANGGGFGGEGHRRRKRKTTAA